MVRTFLFFILTLPVVAAGGSVMQAHDSLRRTVFDFLRASTPASNGDIRIEVGSIDPHTRLPQCERPLEPAFAPGARPVGQTSISLRCAGREPWTIYIPARVIMLADALVAARPLARGLALTAADFSHQRLDLAALPSAALTRPDQLVGRKLRYPVAAGTALHVALLEPAPLVRRGQTVTLLSGRPGFEVSVSAEALANGENGESVRVRNPATRRIVEGIVVAPGRVRAPM